MGRSPSAEADFRRIFDAHHEAVQRYCVRRLRSDDVNDAMAEIFLVMWRRLGAVPEGAEARLWLFGVARNVVRNLERQRHRSRRLASRAWALGDPVAVGPEAELIRRSEDQELIEAMAGLPAKERELLRLKAWEELSNDDIGHLVGISPRAVAMRYNRALKKLGRTLRSREHGMFDKARPRAVEEGDER